MHPEETAFSMVPDSFVPWMRKRVSRSPWNRYSARAQADCRSHPSYIPQIRPTPKHLGGRRPGRPLGLALHLNRAGPRKAASADADAVAQSGATGLAQVEEAAVRIDADGAGPFGLSSPQSRADWRLVRLG
jgi:hypothetical protein